MALLRQKPPDEFRTDAGDMLGVFVEGILGDRNSSPPITLIPVSVRDNPTPPVLGYPVTVQADGTVLLPLIKPLLVRGKSIAEIHDQLAAAYIQGNLIAPGSRIMVSLAKPRSYHVTVVRHPDVEIVHTITALDLPAYENDVLTALARSGGLGTIAGYPVLVIQRGSAANGTTAGAVIAGVQEIRIPLRIREDQPLPFKPEDVILKNGDVISVEVAPAEPPPAPAPKTVERPVAMSLAVATPDGRVLVQLPGGEWKIFDAAKVTATETDGKPVAAIAERLKTMATVLVAANGKPPTPQSLQLAKPGTLVLIVKD